MMIELDGKEYELHFGWDFIEVLNQLNGVVVQGLEMNTGGITKLVGQLDLGDPIAVRLAIKAGTNTYKSKPSTRSIEKFIEELIENDEYDNFLEQLQDEFGKNPLTKIALEKEAKLDEVVE